MRCSDFQILIDDYLDERLSVLRDSFEQHSSQCTDCASKLKAEKVLRQVLRDLPVPPPSAGFETRVLSAAMRQVVPPRRQQRQRQWQWAAAAVMSAAALTIGVFQLQQGENLSPASGMKLADAGIATPQETRWMRVMVKAPRALPGAQIRLELPEGSEFAAYSGQRVLEWTADLSAGQNLLEVPVTGDHAGVAVATISYQGSQRRMLLALNPSRDAQIDPISKETVYG